MQVPTSDGDQRVDAGRFLDLPASSNSFQVDADFGMNPSSSDFIEPARDDDGGNNTDTEMVDSSGPPQDAEGNGKTASSDDGGFMSGGEGWEDTCTSDMEVDSSQERAVDFVDGVDIFIGGESRPGSSFIPKSEEASAGFIDKVDDLEDEEEVFEEGNKVLLNICSCTYSCVFIKRSQRARGRH